MILRNSSASVLEWLHFKQSAKQFLSAKFQVCLIYIINYSLSGYSVNRE